MDACAAVSGVMDAVKCFPGQHLNLQELAFVSLRAAHFDDNGAEVVANASGADAGLLQGRLHDGRLLGVGQSRQGSMLSPGLPALCGIIEERLDGGVGLAPHVAEDLPLIEEGGKGELIASRDLLDAEDFFRCLRGLCRRFVLAARLGARIG